MPDTDLKVFISWSGPRSRAVAAVLRDSLPVWSDRLEVFMSDKDIKPGQRSMTEIETALVGTHYGIIVVTPDNQGSPWLNFEAGAISKAVSGGADQRVATYLVGIERPTDITGPLSQFQAKQANRQGTLEIAEDLAKIMDTNVEAMRKRVMPEWAEIEAVIVRSLQPAEDDQDVVEPVVEDERELGDMLSEALGHLRALRHDLDLRTDGTAERLTSLRTRREDVLLRLDEIATGATEDTQMRLVSTFIADAAIKVDMVAPTLRVIPRLDANGVKVRVALIEFEESVAVPDLHAFASTIRKTLNVPFIVTDASGAAAHHNYEPSLP